MVSLIYLALFGMFMLIIMSIVSNSGETSIVNIENQLFLFNCPSPIFNGVVNATDPGTTIEGFAVVWDSDAVIYSSGNNATGTFFNCYICVGSVFETVHTPTKIYCGVSGLGGLPTLARYKSMHCKTSPVRIEAVPVVFNPSLLPHCAPVPL